MMTDKTNNRIMIAAVSSGCGKTVITTGLLEVLKRKGLAPVSFKCGPDYIDPMFHRQVLGIDSLNLDSYFLPEEGIRELVAGHTGGCAIIEGVMGLYDGTCVSDIKGSSYEIAKITSTPVILVVDAKGAGRTIASVIKGIAADDKDRLIKGVILNRISAHFYEKLRPYLTKELKDAGMDIEILGGIPKDECMQFSSRYLGLTMPEETENIREKISSMADHVENCCDIEAVLKIAEHAPKICTAGEQQKRTKPPKTPKHTVSLAVAGDEAFCFYYHENIRLLEDLGVRIVYFSPIRDEGLPEDISGILIGGGYPELHLKALAENESMKRSLRAAIDAGMPTLAECGGFMYLHETIEDKSGTKYPMVGAVKGNCRYSGHIAGLGYSEIRECGKDDPNDFHSHLAGMRGHEFHYYESTCDGCDALLYKPSSDATYRSMIAKGDSLWGFLHLYYPSHPEAMEAFVRAMKNRTDVQRQRKENGS
ncbi:MAG: cobyrinate a,c-diamide synthase [Lachnospiraceae bacterium]|nr:cobyrinate a,c-diamide synthase [Lachnospiraceae bacterium]